VSKERGEMEYILGGPTLPRDPELLRQINLAAGRLDEKLRKLDLGRLGISEYNQGYLGRKLAGLKNVLRRYAYLLALALADNRQPLAEFTFVDYGGGSGVLSLLAKELGIGRVIYDDIYDVSCKDAAIIAGATGIGVDDHVCGDMDALIRYLEERSLSINAISSHDVIEHIYDMEGYLRSLRLLPSDSLRVVFGCGSNIKHPLIRRKLMKNHLECEYRNRDRQWGHKERDSLRSYLDMRKEIIRAYAPALSEDTVERIARLTRGLMKRGIEKSVDEYRARGEISYKPDHPTNTCDPYTGNWAEHLIRPEWFEDILKDEGFKAQVLSGYYPSPAAPYKRVITTLLNVGIKYLGKWSLYLAPYYIVYADYRGKSASRGGSASRESAQSSGLPPTSTGSPR